MNINNSASTQIKQVFLLFILTTSACRSEHAKATLSNRDIVDGKVDITPTAEATPKINPIAQLGEHSYNDRPDDFPKLYQFHVLYVVTEDFKYTTRDLDGSVDEQVRLVNEWFSNQTDGKIMRLDTYQGQLDITFVILPITEAELFLYTAQNYEKFDPAYHGLIYLHYALEEWLEKANATSPFLSPGKLYITYFESSLAYVCGDGPANGSRILGLYPSAYNLRDQNSCKAFLGAKQENQRGIWENILAHEMIHALGLPSACAKNLDDDGVHINDPLAQNDIMGSTLGIYDQNPLIDPNHDDYYLTNSSGCTDLSNSPFLSPLPSQPYLPPNVLSKEEWRLK